MPPKVRYKLKGYKTYEFNLVIILKLTKIKSIKLSNRIVAAKEIIGRLLLFVKIA